MKTRIRIPSLVLALATGLGWLLPCEVKAQTFTILHNFTATQGTLATNGDGAYPQNNNGLVLSGNTLYGTTYAGGTNGCGTVFAVNTNGTNFILLHSFAAYGYNSEGETTNSDGANPVAGLVLTNGILYGAALYGGVTGNGTVFVINTNGTTFGLAHTFSAGGFFGNTNADGEYPYEGLSLSGNFLYGTAYLGGTNGYGTIFGINTDGYIFTPLYTFSAVPEDVPPSQQTNNDGTLPYGGVILSGNTLYGAAFSGGTNAVGTIFAVYTNGMGFEILHTFGVATFNSNYVLPATNSDGAFPPGQLLLAGDTLYGITSSGGTNGNGTIFAMNTNGTGFLILHVFSAFGTNTLGQLTNSDGADAQSGLILSGSTLYGTLFEGGPNGTGTVFAINTNTAAFTVLHAFSEEATNALGVSTNGDGAGPTGGLIAVGNTLYGTATTGGTNGTGTVFSILLSPPQLTVIHSGPNIIVTWSTNFTGFTLQSATNLDSPAVWSIVSPAPVVVNGQNTITNPLSATQQFYRLSQ